MTDTANAPEPSKMRKMIYENRSHLAPQCVWLAYSEAAEGGDLSLEDEFLSEEDFAHLKHKPPKYVLATHCDKLVAAAYLDAAQRIEQCLWSQHWYIDGESVDPEDLSEGITKRTPDDARAALTAYGERMKAEGASEAQAKIARLTEAANALVDFHNAPLECKRPDMFQRLISRLAAALRENANG